MERLIREGLHTLTNLALLAQMGNNQTDDCVKNVPLVKFQNIRIAWNKFEEEHQMTQKQLFLQSAEDVGFTLKSKSATKVTDYTKVKKLLQLMEMHDIKLGMDMASGTCSGDVQISAFENYHIAFHENDNESIDCFKFSSLLILCSDLTDDSSAPEMFFEAAEDSEWIATHGKNAYMYSDLKENHYMGLQFNDTQQIIYEKAQVDEILTLEDDAQYDSDIIVPDTTRITRNTQSGIVAYVNLQCYEKRSNGGELVYKLKNYSMDRLVDALSKKYSVL